MALVNPNIAMSFRQPEFTPRNAMAEYAQMQQIMNAQDAQQMNALKLQEYQRTREEEEGTRNFLRGRDLSAPETRTGLTQFGKTGLSYAKSLQEQDAARLQQKKTLGEIDANAFKLTGDKLNAAWNLIGSSTSPQAAIAEFTKGVKSGVFKAEEIAEDLQLLGSMTKPEEFSAYLNDAIVKTLDAKSKLEQRKVTTKDTDRGGYIERQTYNAQGVAVGKPTRLDKTATIGETTAQGQLGVSRGNAQLARDKFAFEKANPGFELKEGADGTIYAVNKRTLQAAPVTVGGAAAPAPGGAPDAAAPGTPLKGKVSKDIAVSEQQASYNIGRILDAAKEIDAAIKKDPAALKPRAGEAAAASVGLSGTANVARSAQRQIVYGAQRDAIDAMLTLATGAAYNREQREGQIDSYMPNFTDKVENVEAKRVRMLGLIQNAKVRAGKAWTPELESTVQSLMKSGASSAKPAGGNKPPAAPGASNLTQDQEALNWANSNPNDPRAAEIKKRLGAK